tara:strand:- start:397 stop:603 length:207 start_codon:yes stop_codon:yes gene_type:complete
MSYRSWDVLLGLLGGGIILLATMFFFVPFWALWNWIMPLFGLPTLTILQSIGLYLLLKLVIFTPNTKE